ncbi:dihydroorotate dehydrogenase [Alkalibaculum sp. M08DMB]|uniref:Dihydroorotate dehydrogenase n=1 Tax=Alkalibaculum sporogenes TaxID=2655001 RepID=A0A6A7KBD7_9FIRM|nr:dihydroorotate dehydrogenase [Alkalibaculum sporogenes]MPW26869.1 dihydroorotate dehydrogenase [Alkalibaculum sporogenes]
MDRLKVKFIDRTFKNPVVVASGTYGYGKDYLDYYDPSLLGGICSKGITLHQKSGNKGIRICETPSGLLNSIGLENPGVSKFIDAYLKEMSAIDTVKIINVGGNTIDEYIKAMELLNDCELGLIELNISCPNVKEGGMAFGIKADSAAEVTSKVKKVSRHKIMVKLSPNAENIIDIAKACEDSGADALSLVNTFQAMAIDIVKKESVFENMYAGLSGPAIKPIALRMVNQVYKNVSIPIMGMGGITTWQDAVEFIMAGSSCIQIGTANFIDPMTPIKVIEGLKDYCLGNNIENISDLVGVI